MKAYLQLIGDGRALPVLIRKNCASRNSGQAAVEAVRQARTNDAFLPAWGSFKQAETNLLRSLPQSGSTLCFCEPNDRHHLQFSPEGGGCRKPWRRIVVTAIALERYRLRHKEYPARLSDLTPEFLSKLPIDFMDGKPLRYRPKDDGTYLLYSVGEDGKRRRRRWFSATKLRIGLQNLV